MFIIEYFHVIKFLIQFLKVIFHLQLLQNIGYIPYVVQHSPEPIIHPKVCASNSLPHVAPLITFSLFSLSVSLLLFCYIH